MNQNDIILFANAFAAEKKVPVDTIITAIEKTMKQIVIREIGEGANINVTMNRKDGTFFAERLFEVVEDESLADEEFPEAYIELSEAKEKDSKVNIGDQLKETLEIDMLSRITAHNAKQIMSRLLRDLDREKTAQKYEERIGELVSSTVKKLTKDYLVLETSDGTELMLQKNNLIPKESVRIGDRVKTCIIGLNDTPHGPVVIVSRSHPLMINALFEVEVPEITDGAIEIKASAREPGVRAKVAVKGIDKRIDPIGACVGMRGIRVQSISNELNGERIDIINWNDDPARLAISAIAPAEVRSVFVDEHNQCIDLLIEEDQLSQAIGKNGQNIRLASQLIGWELNVKTDEEEQNINESNNQNANLLSVDEKIIKGLETLSLTTKESFLSADPAMVIDHLKITEEAYEDIKKQLSDTPDDSTSLDTLLSIDDVTIIHLESAGIHSVEDLNKLSIEELKAIDGIDDETAESIHAEAQLFI